MKRTEVSGMYQNRMEWNGMEEKLAEGWWNKERIYLSVKGAFTQHMICVIYWICLFYFYFQLPLTSDPWGKWRFRLWPDSWRPGWCLGGSWWSTSRSSSPARRTRGPEFRQSSRRKRDWEGCRPSRWCGTRPGINTVKLILPYHNCCKCMARFWCMIWVFPCNYFALSIWSYPNAIYKADKICTGLNSLCP